MTYKKDQGGFKEKKIDRKMRRENDRGRRGREKAE